MINEISRPKQQTVCQFLGFSVEVLVKTCYLDVKTPRGYNVHDPLFQVPMMEVWTARVLPHAADICMQSFGKMKVYKSIGDSQVPIGLRITRHISVSYSLLLSFRLLPEFVSCFGQPLQK